MRLTEPPCTPLPRPRHPNIAPVSTVRVPDSWGTILVGESPNFTSPTPQGWVASNTTTPSPDDADHIVQPSPPVTAVTKLVSTSSRAAAKKGRQMWCSGSVAVPAASPVKSLGGSDGSSRPGCRKGTNLAIATVGRKSFMTHQKH